MNPKLPVRYVLICALVYVPPLGDGFGNVYFVLIVLCALTVVPTVTDPLTLTLATELLSFIRAEIYVAISEKNVSHVTAIRTPLQDHNMR